MACPDSHDITIGAQKLHYVDEGHWPGHHAGPRLLCQPAPVAGLGRCAEGQLPRDPLRPPRHGAERPHPDARYDGDAEAALIAQFADKLQLSRFTLVGTSSSGEGVAHFAAQHPERLQGLILANIAAGPIKMDTSHLTPRFKRVLAIEKWLGGWHMRAFWDEILKMNFTDPAKVTPALVREWTELNNRMQGNPRKPWPDGKPPFSGTPDDLKAITAPTLLLWCDGDHETSAETHGQQALALLAAKDKQLAVIPHCGHMMPQECGPQSIAAAMPFIDKVHRPHEIARNGRLGRRLVHLGGIGRRGQPAAHALHDRFARHRHRRRRAAGGAVQGL